MINPMYQKVALSLIRIVLGAAGYAGLVSDDQLMETIGAVLALGTVLWSVWKNFKEQQTLVTALASSLPLTENEAAAMVASPDVLTPSVLTGKDTVPNAYL